MMRNKFLLWVAALVAIAQITTSCGSWISISVGRQAPPATATRVPASVTEGPALPPENTALPTIAPPLPLVPAPAPTAVLTTQSAAATATPMVANTVTTRATATRQAVTVTATLSPTVSPPPAGAATGRVDALMARMTTEEKVGQLFLVFFQGPNLSPALAEMIDRYHVGGIVFFAVSGNIQNPAQVARLIGSAQAEAAGHGAGVPLFVALDQEGGPVVRLTNGVTVFPSNMAVGATGSVDDARLMAEVTAAELKALGFNMNLAPVLDVNNNPDNPVIGVRSFGSSPDNVARLGTTMISAYKAAGIIATAKHFPGHGDTAVDSHVGLPLIPHDVDRLQKVELAPFQAAVKTGVDAIMTAHVLLPALEPTPNVPATLSANVLQGWLRGRLGFQGLILTDSLTMGALAKTVGVTNATTRAFQAGVDVLAFGADYGHTPEEQRPAYNQVLADVRSGKISQARLDESVRRILEAKDRYGLLDWKAPDASPLAGSLATPEHLAAAARIARDSITLVRNQSKVLPVAAGKTVLVITPEGAADLAEALRAYSPDLQALQVGLDPSTEEIQSAVQAAGRADTVILATYGARRHPAQSRLVRTLQKTPLVVVALDSPYDLMDFPDTGCYLATYADVPASLDAAAKVIFGLAQPLGHLPVDLPGLYPIGYGMTDYDR